MIISDLCITNQALPLRIADSILSHHIRPMAEIDKALRIKASENSGYRPYDYEISKGRSGNSQHTFKESWAGGSGAVDWTLKSWNELDFQRLLAKILDQTNYTRVCEYAHFIHCDYKQGSRFNGQKELYKSSGNSQWKFIKYV